MMSTELSRDPSSTITNRSGGSVCRRTDRIASAIYFAWLYDGMMQAIFWLIRQLLSRYQTPGCRSRQSSFHRFGSRKDPFDSSCKDQGNRYRLRVGSYWIMLAAA